jgi:outer membrane receptor protein involved in Fe transport
MKRIQSRNTSLTCLLLAALAILFLLASGQRNVMAQTETGAISGTVYDPSNAVVPKAKVTVRNVATGAERTTTTGDNGDYTVTNLLPGVYAVTVEPTGGGLAKTEQQIEVTVGTKVGLDFHLTLGAAPVTTIEVKAEAGVNVNTENQTMETVVSPKQVLELPTLNTDPYTLVVISGNVSEDAPANYPGGTGTGVGVTINGLRSASTNVLLDGAANNDEFTGSRGQKVPLDSIQEYTVLTNNFTAEFGRASAGVVNVATKSGTNAFHGSAYEFNRVSALAANDYANESFGIAKPVYVRNQFGFSGGGPIIKDKLFFFEDTEWTRIRSNAAVINFIPDAALIAASNANTQSFFSSFGALRPGLKTLQTFSRAQLIAAGADPCAGTTTCAALFSPTSTTPLFDQVQYNVPSDSGAGLPENTYDLVARVDQNLSSRTQMYYRYARYHELDQTGVVVNSPYAGFDSPQTVIDDNALLSVVHQIGNRWTTQTKFVYNRLSLDQPLGKNPVGPTLYFNNISAPSLLSIPVSLPGYSQLFPGNAIPFGGPQNFYQSYEDVSYVKGAHTFRFGGSYVFLADNRTFGAYEEAVEGLGTTGGVNGSRMDNLLNGQLAIFEAAVNPQGKFPCAATVTPACTVNLPVGPPNFSRSNRYDEFAFYGQDSWKVSPRVTINLGLRWEYYGVQHDKNPMLDSNFYEGSGASYFQRFSNGGVAIADQSPVGGLWAKDWHDFAPRLGFAWDIFGNGKWSFRGGYGIAYERNFGNVTFNVIQNPPNYDVISIQPADVGPINITTSNAGPLAGTSGSKALPKASLRNVDQNIRTAYAHLYSASLEHEIAHNVVAALEYSGSKGENLYTLNPNNRIGTGNFYLGIPCTPGDCTARAIPFQYSTVNVRQNLGVSNYNAMNVRVNVNNVANSGVNLLANYTWSKTLDNVSQTFTGIGNDLNLGLTDTTNPLLDRGPADFDNRHRVAISGIWDIPFAKNTHGWMKQALDGWSVAPIFTARSGFGFSIYDCTNTQFQQCPRVQVNGAFPRQAHGQKPLDSVLHTPDTFDLLNLNTLSLSEFTSPVTGNSDFGPYPADMTGRGIFQTPGYYGFDLGVHKWFYLSERFKLEMRLDSFNAFNHPNLFLNTGTAEVSSTPGGFITGCKGNCAGNSFLGVEQHRNIQLGARLTF